MSYLQKKKNPNPFGLHITRTLKYCHLYLRPFFFLPTTTKILILYEMVSNKSSDYGYILK